MAQARRHLRGGVVVWLVCHALMFSAVVPRDCCAAHGHAAAASAAAPSCHEAVPSPAACRLTGTCDAPAAALAAVLLQGTTPRGPVALPPLMWTAAAAAPAFAEHRLSLSVPPDAPPPRA